ncbi:Uncharacterised protein [Candidatus Bartonella washoeensis]|uniref:hypothetical protein n=1 Tax=Candidatus Bartonella washoeensis TaxID=186739 RepID=UPI000D9F9AB8|nr:hypothetical protein [Bartonella washoeensis]SPU27370.1 Uncharacterised protein [Bartonella washoeensis]
MVIFPHINIQNLVDLLLTIHIEHTTLNSNCNCNKKVCLEKSEHTQSSNVSFGHNKITYENKEKGKAETSFPLKGSILPQIKPEMLRKALPNQAYVSQI